MLQPLLLEWSQAMQPPELAADEIHCWRIDLDSNDWSLERTNELLDATERARAERFRIADVARRFRVGRAVLRTLLSRYLNQIPERLQFQYGGLGKPTLAESIGASLSFNLTHSDRYALLAVCREGEIGVDIEVVRPMDDAAGLVRRYFAARETAEFHGLPECDKERAFFVGWTRKEAVIKATGEGIAANLEAIDVGFLPRSPGFEVTLASRPTPTVARLWDLQVAPNLAAAIALLQR